MRDLITMATREAVRLLTFPLPLERRIAIERRLRGLEEFRKLWLADAVVVSFGKSGRTWLRVLLSRFYQVRYGLGERALIGFDNLHRMNRAVPRILFTHDNYIKDYTGHRDDKSDFYGKRVVLLVRDPRDTAVSQFFQWKFRMRRAKKGLNDYPPHGAEVSAFEFVTHPGGGLPKIIDFMNLWARESPRVRDLLVVRYEDLRADTGGELARVLRFLGEEPTPEEIADCVAFASVENMRKMEEGRAFRFTGGRLTPGERGNPDSYKVRRAKVGGWRDYFDDGQVRAIEALIEERLAPGFGYRADEAGAPAGAEGHRRAAGA